MILCYRGKEGLGFLKLEPYQPPITEENGKWVEDYQHGLAQIQASSKQYANKAKNRKRNDYERQQENDSVQSARYQRA